MPLDFPRARPLLQQCDLPRLFVEELGWEPCRQKLTLRVGETDYAFTAIAEKRGFTAWLCETPGGGLPDHATRLKLDRKLSETSFEHLIVFVTADRSRQSWMWVRREPGKPLAARTHEYHRGQPGDSLLQKLQILYVSLEEEEAGLSTVTVAGRARAAFDIERVTKKFYRDFDTHRKAFLKFIEGIGDVADREWYASVMLNRLMFVYFIQRKGFLDGDPAYLRNRLTRCQREHGKDKFYTFYRYFLLRLFHEGFGQRRQDRAPDLEKLLGRVPYLNGGLFDVHELEKPDRYGKDIQIPDQAFERIFDYFDQYQWHLDERPLRADNEINPDVLGYIFEKYINQKQMGAYYTKEDITEYISKNTVLPFLLDAARAKCKVAFEDSGSAAAPAAAVVALDDGSSRVGLHAAGARRAAPEGGRAPHPTVWDLLRENPDRYIYPAVRHGVHLPLPEEIAIGLNPPGLRDPVPADARHPDDIPTLRLRKAWNKPAPADHALPTEIWREVVARRQRYWQLWSRLSGRQADPSWVASPPTPAQLSTAAFCLSTSPFEINDLITLNLDIRQFAQDVIEHCEGPDLLMAFWQALATVTVLDPTCGSGAFLFAALNILEPLYEACLDRMDAFLAEWGEHGKMAHRNYHRTFTEVLAHVAAHPNRRYFILKSIILNNLYGVDIMEEAVEICKLRLFLKLAAQVEPDAARDNLGIEPLPDVDFNIRAGNTLVGYATYDEVKRAVTSGLDFEGAMEKIAVKAADLQQTFDKFRQLQTEGDGSVPAAHKLELQKRLKALEDELNRHLAGEYGVKVSDKAAYAQWVKSHQPFHWFIQFYGILNGGGFDVIIGNPPYVELSTVIAQYRPRNFATETCGNLYALCTERSFRIQHSTSRFGFIVQQPITSTIRMAVCREIISENSAVVWSSTYDDRPSKLFNGMNHARLAIIMAKRAAAKSGETVLCVTPYNKWFKEERVHIFDRLGFVSVSSDALPGLFPKISTATEVGIIEKVLRCRDTLEGWLSRTESVDRLFYKITGVGSWFTITPRPPKFFRDGKVSSSTRENEMKFPAAAVRARAFCVLNSTLFYWFYQVRTNCRDFNPSDYKTFPVPKSLQDEDMGKSALKLEKQLDESAEIIGASHSITGAIKYEQFRPRTSKPILDEIDTVLAGHYGFTAEELDFIIHYDIKYRLGRDAGEAEE